MAINSGVSSDDWMGAIIKLHSISPLFETGGGCLTEIIGDPKNVEKEDPTKEPKLPKGESMKYVNQWNAPSSSGRQTYKVSLTEDNEYQCSCKAWTTRRLECRHIKSVKSEQAFGGRLSGDASGSFPTAEEVMANIAPPPEPPKPKTALEKIQEAAAWRFK